MEPVVPERPRVLGADVDRVWAVAKEELIGRGFRIDRLDRRAEVMATYPLASKQWFEFWRHDVVGSEHLQESSLQTVRRKVSLSLELGDDGRTRLDCEVVVERLAAQRGASGRIIRAKDIFGSTSGKMPTLQSWADRMKMEQHWVVLGRDEALELAVLDGIDKTLTGVK